MTRYFIFSAIALIISGCSYLPFVGEKIDPADFDPQRIAQHLEKQRTKAKNISASAQIMLDSPNFSVSVQAALGVEDSTASATVYNVFGSKWGNVEITDNRVSWTEEKTGEQGYAGLSSFLDFETLPFSAIDLLIGILPPIGLAKIDSFSASGNDLFWEFNQDGKTIRCWFDTDNYLIRKVEIIDHDKKIFKYQIQRIILVGDVFMPRFIQIFMPTRKSMTSIFYEDQTIERKN